MIARILLALALCVVSAEPSDVTLVTSDGSHRDALILVLAQEESYQIAKIEAVALQPFCLDALYGEERLWRECFQRGSVQRSVSAVRRGGAGKYFAVTLSNPAGGVGRVQALVRVTIETIPQVQTEESR